MDKYPNIDHLPENVRNRIKISQDFSQITIDGKNETELISMMYENRIFKKNGIFENTQFNELVVTNNWKKK